MDRAQSHSQPSRFREPPKPFWKAASSLKSGTPYANPRHAECSSAAGPSAEANPPFMWQDFVNSGTTIQYLRDAEATNVALESVKGPFGFDIEWKPNFIKGGPESPIALIQLARPDQIFIIQVTEMNEFPERLRDVLEDRQIVKAGVGISGDAEKLWRDYGVSLLAAVELSQFARVADSRRWELKPGKWIALARLLEAYTSRQLVKTKKIRISNWEASLNTKQLDYAASDALAGFIVHQHLLNLESGVLAQTYMHNYIAYLIWDLYAYVLFYDIPVLNAARSRAGQGFGTQTRKNWKVFGAVGITGLAVQTWILSEAYALDAPTAAEKKDPATSIAFPTTLRLDGEPEMTLLGVGARTVSFLGLKVYSVGFYADLRGVNIKTLGKCESAMESIHVLLESTTCALRIVPTRATSYTHLRDAFMRTLQARQALRRKDGSLVAELEEALHTPLQQFKKLFPTSAVKKHQPVHIILSSPKVNPRYLQIIPLGTIRDSWIATEFFRAYFQGTISPPLIEDVKQGVDNIRLAA